jgi:hypothetical protein
MNLVCRADASTLALAEMKTQKKCSTKNNEMRERIVSLGRFVSSPLVLLDDGSGVIIDHQSSTAAFDATMCESASRNSPVVELIGL